MFRFFYSLGFRKQEIYLILSLTAVIIAGMIIKFFVYQPLPQFDAVKEDKELNLNISGSFKQLDSVRSARLKEMVRYSDSLENYYDLNSEDNFYTPANKLNLNKAFSGDLERLPGIGKLTAERILDYRSRHEFRNIEELKNVKGIGDKKFQKLKDLITVN